MMTSVKSTADKAGLSPGSMIHVGEQKLDRISIKTVRYEPETLEEKDCQTVEECLFGTDGNEKTWIDVTGLHEVDAVEKIGKHFDLHPLVLEDIVNTEQRPKLEDFDDYLFITLRLPSVDKDEGIVMDHFSLVLLPDTVISFREGDAEAFAGIRRRLEKKGGRFRKAGTDYLMYALLDSVVDRYFALLDSLENRIGDVEDELVDNPGQKTLEEIYLLKGELIKMRRSVWPIREVLSSLNRDDFSLINEETKPFIRDVYDHLHQVVETIEVLRDTIESMQDTYHSMVGNKMNQVMTLLTIIAVIFIPLNFLAAIYGMNFKYMPELDWRYGYFVLWFVIVGIGVTLFLVFKRKKWL